MNIFVLHISVASWKNLLFFVIEQYRNKQMCLFRIVANVAMVQLLWTIAKQLNTIV